MLYFFWALAAAMVVAWLVGMATDYSALNGFHLLLVLPILIILGSLFTTSKPHSRFHAF